ncbi:MAG: protein kinase [Deltaproteobacteria bacterium]|nr:protein kinase [Deltaproteobacteria bacterium]
MLDGYGLAAGTIFAGRYAIDRLLKRGGMGAVYAVRHVRTRAELALKIMRPEVVGDASMRERFAREAQVSSIIKSAHVVTVVDADVDPATGMPFLVMELLRGSDLAELSARGPMDPRKVVSHLAQAARGLDRAHALGIVHRDLKPENLFLAHSDDEPPKIKILDFGIAKILQVATAHGRSQEIGTPMYMAPEQMSVRGNIGAWTDVWALGLTAFTLLAGKPYWEGETVHEIYGQILSAQRKPASQRAAENNVVLPSAIDPWLARCLASDPSERFASAGEAIASLAEVFGESWAPTPAPPQVQAVASFITAPMPVAATEPMGTDAPSNLIARPPPPSARFSIALGVTATLGVAIAAVVLLTRSTPEPEPAAPSAEVPSASTSSSAPSLRAQVEAKNPFVDVGDAKLQRHEVTREELALFLATLSPSDKTHARPLGEWSHDVRHPKRPVTWVSFERAERFCRAIGARLPSVADLKSALDGRKYPWGASYPPPGKVAFDRPHDDLPDVESSETDRTSRGVSDLFGSVREWTSDVDGGFATVWGVALETPIAEAASTFATPSQKEADDGDDPIAHASEIAGPQLGFRCAR